MSHFINDNEAANKSGERPRPASRTMKGVFNTLVKEHDKAAALLSRLAKSADIRLRAKVYPVVRTALLAHERAEMAVVYSKLEQYPEMAQVVAHHKVEAGELEAAVRALDAIEFTSDRWAPALRELFALVRQHVVEEEGDYFPRAQKLIGEDEAQELDRRYERARTGQSHH